MSQISNITNGTNEAVPRQGWTSSPGDRGTIDIIWTCLTTIFLCTWTVLCLNVSGEDENQWQQLKRKLRWSALAIFGPEFLLTFAIGQYADARRVTYEFHKALGGLKSEQWTIQHSFYANMGGFVLETIDYDDPFPVSASQILWLVKEGFLNIPKTTKSEIADKSKADTLAKLLTIVQTTWFVLQSFGRAAQHLAFTPLELAISAFVFCTLPTYFFWLHKPTDVSTPTHLELRFSLSDITATHRSEPIDDEQVMTPLDKVEYNGPTWTSVVMEKLPKRFKTVPKKRPIQRFSNDRLPNLEGLDQTFLFFVTMAYPAIHLIGWDFNFASSIERWLWRTCSLMQIATTFIFWLVDRNDSWSKRGFYGPLRKTVSLEPHALD